MKRALVMGLIGVVATPAIGQYPPGYGETPPPAPRYTPRLRYTPPPSPRYTARPLVPSLPSANRKLYVPPIPGFVVGYSKRVGQNQIVEFVPRGQTIQRYTNMISINSFPVRAGLTSGTVLARFVERYTANCRGASANPITFADGSTGARVGCPRTVTTGKMETSFVRVVLAYPVVAVVQYTTTYITMPDEARRARDFLSRVAAR